MIRLKQLLQEDIENISTLGSTPDEDSSEDYQLLYDGWETRGVNAANYLVSKGFNKIIAAAFIGNFAVESGVRANVSQNRVKGLKTGTGFKPTPPDVAKKQPGWAGYGLAQWTQERRASLISAGAATVNQQLNFVISELNSTESSAWKKIKSTKTLSDATAAVVKFYERAGTPALSERISKATTIYNRIK